MEVNVMSTAQLHRHVLLEHQEDIAFSFIHDELTREVLEHYGIEPLFFVRHFGKMIVEEIVDTIEQESMNHSCIALEVMQAFFQHHNKELKMHDMSLLRKGIKKTLVRFSQYLTADETFKIEALLDGDEKETRSNAFFTIEENEEMHEVLEDLEHFVSKLSVDTFFLPGFTHSIERVVILFESYSHLLKSNDAFFFLSDKLLELSLSLRVLHHFEGSEVFEKIQEHLVLIVTSLIRFHESVEKQNFLHLDALDKQITDDIDCVKEFLVLTNEKLS